MNTRFLSRSVLSVALATAVLGFSGAVFAADDEKPHSSSASVAISDAVITGRVKARFMEDARLKGTDISVTTVNGIVMLKGTAPDTATKNVAEELAKHAEGALGVQNNIYTPSIATEIGDKTKAVTKDAGRAVSDSWITTKVKSVLLADSLTKGLQINVITKKHVVMLAGEVGTPAARDQAISLATQIKGVESVDSSNLKVVKVNATN